MVTLSKRTIALALTLIALMAITVGFQGLHISTIYKSLETQSDVNSLILEGLAARLKYDQESIAFNKAVISFNIKVSTFNGNVDRYLKQQNNTNRAHAAAITKLYAEHSDKGCSIKHKDNNYIIKKQVPTQRDELYALH